MPTRYQLSIHAEKLPRGMFRPNPYAKVTVCGGPQQGTEIGKTETLHRTTDPDWLKILFFETDSSIFMPLKVEIMDERGVGIEDRKIGEAQFEATEVAESTGHMQFQELDDGGKIYMSVEESVRGDAKGQMSLHLRGLDIKNIEAGILGLGRSDPFFEIAKKNADHAAGLVGWSVVYRSKHIHNHLNPFWEPLTVGLEELCYCDLDWPIRIDVKDFQKSGKHRLIGQFETTPNLLRERVATKGNADRDMAFEIFLESLRDAKTRGLIVVLKAELFLD